MPPVNIPIAENWSRTSWDNWTTGYAQSGPVQLGDAPSNAYNYSLSTQEHIDLVPSTWTYRSGITMACTTGTHTFSYTLPEVTDFTQVSSPELILNLVNYPTAVSSGYIQLIAADGSNSGQILALGNGAGRNCYKNFTTLPYVNLTEVSQIVFSFTTTASANVQVTGLRCVSPQWVLTSLDFDNANNILTTPIPVVGTTAVQLPTIWRSALTPGVDDPQPINTSMGIAFNTGSQTALNQFTLYLRGSADVPVLEGIINNQLVGTLNGYALNGSDSLPPSIQTSNTNTPNAYNVQATIQWGNFHGTLGYQITLQNSLNSVVYQYNSLVSADILNVTALAIDTEYLFYVDLEDETIEVTIYPFNPNASGFLGSSIFTSAPILDSSVFYRTPGHIGFNASFGDVDAYVTSIQPYHTMFAAFESSGLNSRTPVIGAQLYAQNTPPSQLFYPPWIPLTSDDGVTPTVTTDSGRTLSGQSFKIIFGASQATETFQGVVTQPLTPIGDPVSGITDFNAVSASFDIWIESSALTDMMTPFMGTFVNEQGYGIPLLLPTLTPNKWNAGNLNLSIDPNEIPEVVSSNINTMLAVPVSINALIPTGLYKFCLMYMGNAATTIWIDNVQITSNAINWYGRSTQDNPYTQDLFPWVPFNDTMNTESNGIRFDQPGFSLQVRAEALQQDAEVYNGYTLVPSYGQLGRIVINKSVPSVIPTSTSGTMTGIYLPGPTSLGQDTYEFTCEIINPTNHIYNITWSFGDGNYAYDQWIVGQPNVTRTYQYILGSPNIGQYYVTANVQDNYNNKGYGTTTVTI